MNEFPTVEHTTESMTGVSADEGPFGDKLASVFREPELTQSNFDGKILNETKQEQFERLKVVYFWGHQCPNCDYAKSQLAAMASELSLLPVDFFAINAYENMELVTRFGLYGIPAFLFFKRGRLIGRISSFPTRDEFLGAIRRKI